MALVGLAQPTISNAWDGWDDAPFVCGWSDCPLDAELDLCSDGECRPYSMWRCRWDRYCRRCKPLCTCYPDVLPVCDPHYGYHETCWRRLPPQYNCPPPHVELGPYPIPGGAPFVLPVPDESRDEPAVPPAPPAYDPPGDDRPADDPAPPADVPEPTDRVSTFRVPGRLVTD